VETYGNDSKNLKMTRGDTANISVEGLTLVAGDEVKFTVKENVHATTKIIEKTVVNFNNGNGIISIEPDDTKSLNYKNYIYDIQVTRADGTVYTVVKPHEFKIESEVTF
jgi:phage gp45-like